MRAIVLACLVVLALTPPAPAGMRDDLRLLTGARAQSMAVVEEAMAAGADIDAGDAARRTALMWSAFHGNETMLGYLLERGADVNLRDRRGRSALIWAAIAGQTRAAESLLVAGADAALVDREGRTAAGHALAEGHEALAELLAAPR